MPAMPRIDAHQHYWTLARGDYGWLTPALAPIHRDYAPPDLAPLLDACGIAGTVLVQAAPTDAETDYLRALAAQPGSRVLGVVAWSALSGAGALARLRALAADPVVKSVRPMLQDIADPQWVLAREHEPAFALLEREGVAFDALVRTEHLASIRTLAGRHPGLRIVVDHGAKPPIAQRRYAEWAEAVGRLAAETRASCKLSGMVTEAGVAWTVADLGRYVDHLVAAFGPGRLMWGSDWPVLNLAADYPRWWRASLELLQRLEPEARDGVLGGNAMAFYRLAPPATGDASRPR